MYCEGLCAEWFDGGESVGIVADDESVLVSEREKYKEEKYGQVESLVYGSHWWSGASCVCLVQLVLSLKRPPLQAMVKLTPELLVQAPSTINPVRERQLDLRGESHNDPCIPAQSDPPQRIQNPRHRKLGCHQGMYRLITFITLPVVSSHLQPNPGPTRCYRLDG